METSDLNEILDSLSPSRTNCHEHLSGMRVMIQIQCALLEEHVIIHVRTMFHLMALFPAIITHNYIGL